jgi:type I restriction enzyme S subunit
MAVENLITEHLDIWTSAIKTKSSAGRGSSKKLELVGVKKLRELILELAVRGKLVPQDPNDEPASELLKKIEAEKAQLVKEGLLKKQKPLPPISDDEKPFELPESWILCRLGQIIQISSGTGLTAANMNKNGQIPVYGGNGVTGFHDQGNVFQKTLVIGRVGYYCGSVHLTPAVAWVTDNAFVTTFSEENIFIDYLVWLLKGTNLKEDENATAQPVISGRKLYPISIALPPKQEQHRIVAKVDELMALCDQLEAKTESSINAHKTLVEVLLATLTDAKNADELNDNWQTISQHFDVLFTTQASIDQLKQTILQLAVMGKLVKQDPKDEPAAKLLERIATEKQQLIKDGKIKKQKLLSPITDEEKPFELPKGWEWVRFGLLFKSFSNGLYKPAKFYTDNGVISLRMYNIQYGEVDFNAAKRVEVEPKELEQFLLETDDLLINRVNSKELVGKTAIIPNISEPLVYESMNMRAKPHKEYLSARYLNLFMMTSMAQESISSFAKEAVGQASINQGQVSSIKTPLPPLAEQHFIVTKVVELIGLCDSLKERLNQAHTTQIQVTDAIVEQAL